MSIKKQQWLASFKPEFERRTGITWEEGGNTDQDAIDRWCDGKKWTPPDWAVSFFIEKYDLKDITT